MNWRDELSPVKNWQGWLATIVILAVFGLVGALERAEPQTEREATWVLTTTR